MLIEPKYQSRRPCSIPKDNIKYVFGTLYGVFSAFFPKLSTTEPLFPYYHAMVNSQELEIAAYLHFHLNLILLFPRLPRPRYNTNGYHLHLDVVTKYVTKSKPHQNSVKIDDVPKVLALVECASRTLNIQYQC